MRSVPVVVVVAVALLASCGPDAASRAPAAPSARAEEASAARGAAAPTPATVTGPSAPGASGGAPAEPSLGPQNAAAFTAPPALPELDASRDVDCRIRIALGVRPLPPEVARVAVLLQPHGAASPSMRCAGRVVAELPRAVFDTPSPGDVAVVRRLDASVAACGDDVDLSVCGRDAAGALHPGAGAWSREVAPYERWDGDRVETPSGDVRPADLGRGSMVVGRDPSGAPVEARVRSARHADGKAAVRAQLDDGRTLLVPADLRFVVVGAAAPRRARDLVAQDAIPTRDGGVVRVVAPPVAVPGMVDRTLTDVDWPDTYYWAGLAVADDGRAASPPPASPPAPVAPVVEQATLEPALQSWDCQVMTGLVVRALPAGATAVVVVAAPQHGAVGARTQLDCVAGARVATLPRALVDAARADGGDASLALTLSGGPITCDAHVALLPCAEDAAGALVALAPSARDARGGAACVLEGTPVATPDGDVEVERLTPGMTVLAYDPEARVATTARVEHITQRTDARVLAVEVDPGLVLRVTPEHLVWNAHRHHFARADALRVGDVVRTSAGESRRVVHVGLEVQAATVYDVSVTAPHTYFAWGILVHNY